MYLLISYQMPKGQCPASRHSARRMDAEMKRPGLALQGAQSRGARRSEWAGGGGGLRAKLQLEQGCLCALLTYICHLILTQPCNSGSTGVIMPILWMTKPRFKEVK